MDEEFREPPNSFTVLRAKFYQWFAGIVAGTDKIEANVVIAFQGAVSLIAEKAGLKKLDVKQFALGIKEIIELPEKTIEERFNLASGEGAAQLFPGQCIKEMPGGGFIYTNKTSLCDECDEKTCLYFCPWKRFVLENGKIKHDYEECTIYSLTY